MAYGPLAHGLLTGAITRETVFDETDWRAAGVFFGQPLLTAEHRDRNFAVIDELARFAAAKSCSLAQLAIAWVLASPDVTVALVGARNEEEIKTAAEASNVNLSDDDLISIDTIMASASGMTETLPAGGTSRATRQQGATNQ
jgi:aryl-alcohol dehydrogenase-like predicted oxidoreductase